MSDFFIGEIRMFGGNFAPKNWALCNGQILGISQNSALFSLLGTTYGGNGVSTFALPNLQGRLPMSFGQGPGLASYALGQFAGTETVTLTNSNLPSHNHLFMTSQTPATTSTPATGAMPSVASGAGKSFVEPGSKSTTPLTFDASAIGFDGSNQPHSNLMPSLCISFIIATVGIYPSRN